MIAIIKQRIQTLVWGGLFLRYGLAGRIFTGLLQNMYAVLRDMLSGQLTLRAMGLVYTTLLSVVPLIALSFSVLKGFGVHKQLESQLYAFLDPLGDKGVEITSDLMSLVHNVNGSVLGGIGLAFLIYTAVSMVKKTEEAFNYVWYVNKPRSFARRFAEYLFVLLTGPIAIVIALGAIATLESDAVTHWLRQNSIAGPILIATGKLTPYLVITGIFTFLYWFMPNTRVKFRSALVGGIAGGVLWTTIGMIFAAFLANSARTQAIYASFAITITALIWLYLSWLILLIGSQIAFYYQNPAYLRIGRREPRLSNAMRERLALNIMFLVGKEFRNPVQGQSLRDLSRTMRIPSITLAPVAAGLESAGLISSNENEALLPGREMSRISLREIVDVVRHGGETGSHREPRWDHAIETLGQNLDDAVAGKLSDLSLADLLDDAEQEI